MKPARSSPIWNLKSATCNLQLLLVSTAFAQLQLLPEKEPHSVFSGEQKIAVTWHNPDAQPVEIGLQVRLVQTTSATAVLLTETPWKRLQVLPGQTVLESATLRFPAVKAETRFLVQWIQNTNRILGASEVFVYPADLLKELRPLAGEEPLGVYDPQNEIMPLLKPLGIEFVNLQKNGVEDFHGKLAIVGPFRATAQIPTGFPDRVKKLAEKGVGVVWIVPPPAKQAEIEPSFFTFAEGKGVIVGAQPSLVFNLSDSPLAQQNLIQFCRQALRPSPFYLPALNSQP